MPFPPQGWLAIVIDQIHVVLDDVHHQGIDQGDGLFFYSGIVHQFCNRTKGKNMSNHFIRRSGGFPIPLRIGSMLPAFRIFQLADEAPSFK